MEGSETVGVVVGNHQHKRTSANPAIRWLMRRFLVQLEDVLDDVRADAPDASVLEVGCGEGEVTTILAERWPRVVGIDLPDAGLRRRWATIPDPRFVHGDAQRLPFADGAFDVVVAVEVLEHLPDPQRGLEEIVRVASGHVVASVPREPLFRGGNLAAGRHVRALGNTPGHVNHWSARGFRRFVSSVSEVQAVRRPLPWTIVRARV